MAQKQMPRSVLAPGAPASLGLGDLPSEAVERVREMIAGGHSKQAVQLAKDLYKRAATEESEALLIEAYGIRIADLIQLRMTAEAKALVAVVRQRFPASISRLADLEQELYVLEGRLDGIVGPLGDADLDAEKREAIEAFIRQRIDDLSALAGVKSLPLEHPLRSAAAALGDAFRAVTEGPVNDETLALPQVSRRSPLASWKALVQAIACYYRHEDGSCRKWLAAITADSIPARLIPPMTAMLDGKTEAPLSSSASRLVAAVRDRGVALRASLAVLEAAFAARKEQPTLNAIRAFSVASIGVDAALRERLRQHIAVRCIMQHIPRPAAEGALGGSPKLDAYFYRLLARSLDETGAAEGLAEGIVIWGEFRNAAIREGWFAAGGLEDGVLALHMAETVAKLPAELIEMMEEGDFDLCTAGKGNKSTRIPSAEMLFERACQADASADAFASWLRWAKQEQDAKSADEVAERWRKARPTEIPPLLHLMESAEQRNAFKKALKYLGEAEALDRLNPAVRRSRARLLLASVLRHLREHKTHLAQVEIEQLLTVPEMRPGEVAMLALALRWCCAAVDQNNAAREEHERELVGAIGPVAAHLLLRGCNQAAQWPTSVALPPLDARRTPPAELLSGAIRACSAGNWVGLAMPLAGEWKDKLIAAVHQSGGSVDAAQLLVLGEAALADKASGNSSLKLAYAVSTVGMALGNAQARFLFLRARALPFWMYTRRKGCLLAALELARRDRDMELAGKVLDQLGSRFSQRQERVSLSPELLSAIVEEERKFKKFPSTPRDDRSRYAEQLDSIGERPDPIAGEECDCPECRASRGESVDDRDEDWDDEDEEDFDVPLPKGIPPTLGALLGLLPPAERRELLDAMAAGKDVPGIVDKLGSAVQRLFSGSSPGGSKETPPEAAAGSRKKKRKSRQAVPPPVQDSLF